MNFVMDHIYQHIICLCSGFNFLPDLELYRIPKILSKFWISGIPVASLIGMKYSSIYNYEQKHLSAKFYK